MRINRSFRGQLIIRLNRACVAGALEKDRHGFQRRFDPPLLCSSHKSHALIGMSAIWVKLFFNEADVAAAFHAGEPDP
jgi:hypothetical protein